MRAVDDILLAFIDSSLERERPSTLTVVSVPLCGSVLFVLDGPVGSRDGRTKVLPVSSSCMRVGALDALAFILDALRSCEADASSLSLFLANICTDFASSGYTRARVSRTMHYRSGNERTHIVFRALYAADHETLTASLTSIRRMFMREATAAMTRTS